MEQIANAFTHRTNPAAERAGSTRHAQTLVRRAALTLAMAAVWGGAAGSAKPLFALLNVYKVPMVLSLSILVALPAVLVTRSLLRVAVPPLELVSAIVSGLERGAL